MDGADKAAMKLLDFVLCLLPAPKKNTREKAKIVAVMEQAWYNKLCISTFNTQR
jgi:hypothetical protein